MKVTNEQIEQWRQHVAQHGSIKEAAAYFGVIPHTIQPYVSDALKEFKAKRNAAILEMRHQRKSMKEIADALGISETTVSNFCKKAGMGGQIRSNWATLMAMEAQKRGREKALSRIKAEQEAKYREQVEVAGLEYLGGYTNCDGYVNVRYPLCGHEGRLSCVTLRQRNLILPCAVCEEEQHQRAVEDRERQKAEVREAARLEREARKAAVKAERDARRNVCKVCGTEFRPDHFGNHYCSDLCRKKAINRQHEARKRGQRRTIQLEQVYQRDKGRCYLCGCSCDFDDYQVIDGAFVVGPTYPTVEHVIPFCRGGDDSWENVRLACHRCNSIKGRKSDVRVEKSGQIAFVL